MAPSNVCVFSGTDVNIYCTLPGSIVAWSNAQFGVSITSIYQKEANLGPDIQLCFIDIKSNDQQTCSNSSAMVQNIPKSFDALDITCKANNLVQTSQLLVITVIGKIYSYYT